MISDQVRTGFDKAPHRSLFRTLGLTDKELSRPLIAVVSAKSDIIPGHMHLDQIAEAVKAGVYAAGGSSSEHQRIYHGGLLVKLLGYQRPQVNAIAIETAMQNSGLATSLAATSFASVPMAAIPGAIFSVWHNVCGAVVANLMARTADRQEPSSAADNA